MLIGDQKPVQEEVLGIGRVYPNSIATIESTLDNAVTQSWDGEIHCERSIKYSSFTTSVVEVEVSQVYIFLDVDYSNTLCIRISWWFR